MAVAIRSSQITQKEEKMSKLFQQLIQEITEWQDSVFMEATPLSAATHLQREVRELIFDLKNGNPKSSESEMADCFLLIIATAHLSGVDLEAAIEEKMEINRNRVWGKPDAEGVVEHIREGRTLVEIFTEEGVLPRNSKILFSGFVREED